MAILRLVTPFGRLLAAFLVACAVGCMSAAMPAYVGPGASPSAAASPSNAEIGTASRLAIPELGVDLPVIAGELDADGDPAFPPCDIAAFLPYYAQPGSLGTTYLYAHARRGMLLTLLEASRVDDGSALIGEQVDVYTIDGQRYTYEIFVIKRHAVDYSLADEVAQDEHRLVIQTSEGAVGHPEKVQVGARLVATRPASLSEARPSAAPRDCSPQPT